MTKISCLALIWNLNKSIGPKKKLSLLKNTSMKQITRSRIESCEIILEWSEINQMRVTGVLSSEYWDQLAFNLIGEKINRDLSRRKRLDGCGAENERIMSYKRWPITKNKWTRKIS
jgi:hypothetical protein